MFRQSVNQPLYNTSEKIALFTVTVGLTLTLVATAAMAGTSVPQPPNTAQTFGSGAAKHGFNRQPEQSPGLNLNIHMFNPQPEPPPGLSLNSRMFNPQPEPPALNGFINR